MRFRDAIQLLSIQDLRNGAVAILVAVGGLGLAAATYLAHAAGNSRLAGVLAAVSLAFVIAIVLFVIPPLGRNASREAAQLDLPFEFTVGGLLMLGLIALVGFSAWKSGNNLLFLILSVLLGAMIAGFIAGNLCLKKLDVTMRFPEAIFAEDETAILVTIRNRKRFFASHSVIAEVRGRDRDRSELADELSQILPARIARRISRPPIIRRVLGYFLRIGRRSSEERRGIHVFASRGRWVIKDFEISTKFPFGFFRHRRRLPARETELVVLPKPATGLDPVAIMPLDRGEFTANVSGSGQDLLSMRDYRANDDLRRIDWKATARARKLIVREFAAEDDLKVTLIFDTRVRTDDRPQLSLRERIRAEAAGVAASRSPRFESAVSIAAGLVARYCDEQTDVRLIIDGTAGSFGTGTSHLIET